MTRSGQEHSDEVSQSPTPHGPLPEYYGEQEQRQRFLNDLFDRTAVHYRRIDQAAGFGSGGWYRRHALAQAGLQAGMRVLDVACGPGLVAQSAQQLMGQSSDVIGLDASMGMLKEAQSAGSTLLVRALGEQLPFHDHCFDFLSMGYALRHVADLETAFSEYSRVLKPRGIILILELSLPSSKLLRGIARVYIREILSRAFYLFTGERAVATALRYWWDTTALAVAPSVVLAQLEAAGFTNCVTYERVGGTLREYRAINRS